MENKALCRKISSMLSLYIDNRVTYQQRAFIEDHLSNCEECCKKFLYLKSLIKDLKDSYKQVLELAVKKQKQKTFSIREHEKFLENISPYVDNELDAQECFDFRKYLMKSKNAQKELKLIYIIQKNMRSSFDRVKKETNPEISKNVINKLRNRSSLRFSDKIVEIIFTQKTLKIAILAGLVMIAGIEFEQLYTQHKTHPVQTESKQNTNSSRVSKVQTKDAQKVIQKKDSVNP